MPMQRSSYVVSSYDGSNVPCVSGLRGPVSNKSWIDWRLDVVDDNAHISSEAIVKIVSSDLRVALLCVLLLF